MKTIILCGGRGVRLSEETNQIPKPMVKIGNMPILLHVMKIYNHYNFKNFILALGYKQEIIREYFLNFKLNNSDININLKDNKISFLKEFKDDINVSLIDTGEATLTGDRLLQLKTYIEDDYFCMTYADGVSDINLLDVLNFHKTHGKLVTITAVKNISKFGNILIEDNKVISFREKPAEENYINGGFMVLNKNVFNHLLHGDFANTLEKLAKEDQLMCYKHDGSWKCVDTINDLNHLNELWNTNKAPWKIWE